MFIYVIVNSATLKIYVGQHKGNSLRKYLQTKFSDAQHQPRLRSRLYRSMRKHSKDVWSIHPLISGLQTREECDHWEQMLIRALNTQHPDVGYNIQRGGEGFTGPHTEEWRKETLDRVNAYWAKPESRELRSQEMTERWTDPAFQQSQAAWKAANPEKMAYWKGKKQSTEANQKRSINMKGKQQRLGQTQSPEERAKHAATLEQFRPKGPFSDERKAGLKLAHETCSCPHHVRKRHELAALRLSLS